MGTNRQSDINFKDESIFLNQHILCGNKISLLHLFYASIYFIIPDLSQNEKQYDISNTSEKIQVFVGKRGSERDKLRANYRPDVKSRVYTERLFYHEHKFYII